MRPGANAWIVIGTIAGVICAIAATYQLIDRWRPGTTPPGGVSDPPPTVEDGTPADEAVSPTPPGNIEAPPPEPTASKVESLINRRAVPSGSGPLMAIALDGDSVDVELMEVALAREASSAELRLVSGLFKPAFRERGFLRAVYNGDTEPLSSSGALAAVDRVLVGRVERACRATGQFDSDLITCDVGLYFKIFDRHGAIANTGHVAVAGAGFSEGAARDRAIEMLVQQHGKKVISPE